MPTWLNRSTGTASRNGGTSHTITFTTDGSAPFTPTSGRLLVMTMSGGVTSTTPTGWTLVASAVGGTGLYVWSRTVSGDTAITTSHGAVANYPVLWEVWEFPATTTVVGTAGSLTGQGTTAWAQVTSLPGTAVTVLGIGNFGVGSVQTSGSAVFTAPWTEDVDTFVAFATTDGAYLATAYQDGVTATTAIPAGTVTVGGTGSLGERITLAVQPPSDTTPPSAPTGLTTTSVGSTTADLSWTAATDDVAVTGYEITVVGP